MIVLSMYSPVCVPPFYVLHDHDRVSTNPASDIAVRTLAHASGSPCPNTTASSTGGCDRELRQRIVSTSRPIGPFQFPGPRSGCFHGCLSVPSVLMDQVPDPLR